MLIHLSIVEFEWKDGLRLLINNKLQINEDDLPSFSDDESPCPQQEVVLNHQRSSSLRTSKIPAVAGVLSYKVIVCVIFTAIYTSITFDLRF